MKNLIDLAAAMLGLMLTFPPFISVILRFKQVVPFPSFSPWYRLQGIPFLFDLLLFSHWVMYSALWPHGLHHARLPCPSPSPEVCSSPCPLSQWCHPTISSSVIPFSCLQSFPASGFFLTSQLFTSGGLRIGTWASVSVLPSGLISFRIDCFDLLAVQGSLNCLIQHQSSKASILQLLAFLIVQLTFKHDYCKNHSFDYTDLCQQSNISAF